MIASRKETAHCTAQAIGGHNQPLVHPVDGTPSEFSPSKCFPKKGRGADERRAKSRVVIRAGARGGAVCVMGRKISYADRGKKIPRKTEQQFSEKFSPVIEDMNVRRIAKATGRSVETVKAWRARRAFPNGASLINAAKAFPAIKAWLLKELEDYEGGGFSPDITRELMWLERNANAPGPNGEAAKLILQAMHTITRGGKNE